MGHAVQHERAEFPQEKIETMAVDELQNVRLRINFDVSFPSYVLHAAPPPPCVRGSPPPPLCTAHPALQ